MSEAYLARSTLFGCNGISSDSGSGPAAEWEKRFGASDGDDVSDDAGETEPDEKMRDGGVDSSEVPDWLCGGCERSESELSCCCSRSPAEAEDRLRRGICGRADCTR